ncbi:MAG: tetratricopeptide repeat protein [Acidobacteriota bacterium]|nr:tetratricopeptide repeat protein [Acidobacteriota bacterium]
MNFRGIFLVGLCLLIVSFFGFFSPVSSQDAPPAPTPRSTPEELNFTRRVPNPPAVLPVLTRQQRQLSYAKLMEAQRYMWRIKNRRTNRNALPQMAKPAFEALYHTIEINPGFAEAYTAMAELAFMATNDLAEAERLAKFAVGFNPDNLGAHQILSQIYTLRSGLREDNLNREETEKAIAEWREIARLDPRNAEAWAFLSEFYERTNETEKAVEALTKWSGAASPADGGSLYRYLTGGDVSPESAAVRLGRAFLRGGRANDAVAILSRAVTDDPDNEEAVLALQDAVQAMTDSDANAAIEALKPVVYAAANSAALAEILANTQIRAGKTEEAAKTIKDARAKFPENDSLVRLEANVLMQLGKVDEAVSLLRSKIVNKTKQVSVPQSLVADFLAHLTISDLYVQAGRGADAVGAARQALELAQNDDMTKIGLLALASAQNAAGNFRDAETSLREVLKKEPENPTALNNLGYFLIERGERLPEALNLIKRAVAAEPGNASFLDSLGWAYYRLNQFAEAERHLSDAARRSPNSATIQEHLGDVYEKQGKIEQARNAWRRALTLLKQPADINRVRAKINDKK